MDKCIIAEYLPVYGWTKVRHTSKFEGAALVKCLGEMRRCPNAAYVQYNRKVVACNALCATQFPSIARRAIRG